MGLQSWFGEGPGKLPVDIYGIVGACHDLGAFGCKFVGDSAIYLQTDIKILLNAHIVFYTIKF
jgi:hypothetical protein